jgi:peptidoglycan/LPS O-acetylase OafA/YrhL
MSATMASVWSNYRQRVQWRAGMHRVFHRGPQDDPVVDGLRGMASLSIVLFHCFYGAMVLLKDFDRISVFAAQLPPWLGFLANADKAVDVFFMVSAYLLGGALMRETERSGTIAARDFYIRRLFRIYPLFLLGLAVYALGNPGLAARNLVYNLLFIDNFQMKNIIPVGWSLSIEMQFYLVLPMLMGWLLRMPGQGGLRVLQALFLMSFVPILTTALLYPVTYETPFYLFHPQRVAPELFLDVMYFQTHARVGPLLLGLMWAWVRHHDAALPTPPARGLAWALGGAALALVWAYFPVYQQDSWYYQHFSPWLNLTGQVLHRNLFCLGVLLLVLLVQAGGAGTWSTRLALALRAVWGWALWRPFSQVVFPVYLFHFPMVLIAAILTFQTTDASTIGMISVWQLLCMFGLAVSLSLLLGIVLHVLIEQPMIDIGHAWLRKRAQVVPGRDS